LITKQDFDLLKAKLENKVEQIRKPEIEPLEKRISAMEEDIDELKRLLRGISQRLPVIVE
jgi:phage shock protein A